MLNDFFFSEKGFSSPYDTEKYFQAFCDLKVLGGGGASFDYRSRVCKIGESCVSVALSHSGWGYEHNTALEGFIGTIPETGKVNWKNGHERFKSRKDELFIVNNRDVIVANYDQHTYVTTIFLSYADIFRYLCLLIGDVPKAKLFFTSRTTGKWEAQCLREMVRTILVVGSNPSPVTEASLIHLKESLIAFWLYNINNTFSCFLTDPDTTRKLSPHFVNLVAEYIQCNSDKYLTVSQLAACAGVSIRALQLGFKKFKNTTPMNYLRDIRLAKARSMLMDAYCADSVQETAFQCGFTNFQLFSKYYRIAFLERPTDTKKRSGSSKV